MIGRGRLTDLDRWVHRDSLRRCSLHARLLFTWLPLICDDHGHTKAAPAFIAGQFFYDEGPGAIDEVRGSLVELERAGELRRYVVRGEQYLTVIAWRELVRPDRFTGRQWPSPEEPINPPPSQPDLFAPPDNGAPPRGRSRLRLIPTSS